MVIRDSSEPHAEWDEKIIKDIARHYRFVNYGEHAYFMDVGAHVGAWTAYVKRQNPNAHVIAAEVNDDNYALALENVGSLPGVSLHHARVAYTAGDFVQYMWLTNSGSNVVLPRQDKSPATRAAYEITVPDVTLEALIEQDQFPRIDVLKLDCETAEYDIIPNMSEELLKSITHIMGEYHDGIDRFRAAALPRLEQFFSIEHLDEVSDWGLFHCVQK